MLKKISITALLAGTVAFGISQATHAEMPGFYAGAQLGYGNTHIKTSDLVTVYNSYSTIALPNLDDMLLAYRLSFGYQLSQHFAVEFGYRRFSGTNINASNGIYSVRASSQEKAFDLVGKSILSLTKKLTIYGKWGIAYVRPNSQGHVTTIGSQAISTTSYSNALEPTWSLGISYALKPSVPIDFSWNRIQKIGGNNQPPSSDFYAVGVAYYFG